MSFMNITFEMIYHVVSAYMDAIGILLVPIGMAIVGLFYLIYIFGWLNIGNFRKIKSSNEQNELSGKNFIFLGSSVTKGMAAYGKSFVDMIAARNHSNVIKEAVSGTTLVEKGKKNYITRLTHLAMCLFASFQQTMLPSASLLAPYPIPRTSIPLIPKPSAVLSSISSLTPRKPGIAPWFFIPIPITLLKPTPEW